jgi:hypothetical protein
MAQKDKQLLLKDLGADIAYIKENEMLWKSAKLKELRNWFRR